MSCLNGSIDQIREDIRELQPLLNSPMYFGKGLLEMTEDKYKKLTKDKKELFDKNALMFCLMLRKEFGQESVHKMMQQTANNGDGESAIKKVLDFDNYDHFDRSFKRYMSDLCNDVSTGKTPDTYLQIRKKKD